jgi:hypothetical protein
VKWFQDEKGNTSSMRIMAMLSTVTGCVAVLAGVTAIFLGNVQGVPIATVGAGMTGLGEISKAWQAQKGS